jgi:ribosomal protein L29
MNKYKKKENLDFVNDVRQDLVNIRMSKAQKRNFFVSKYIKTRKKLARLLTQINKK